MMTLLCAIWLALPVLPQDPPVPAPVQDEATLRQRIDDLTKLVEKLTQQVADLEKTREKLGQENVVLAKEVEALGRNCAESAREILMLRQALKEADGAGVKPTDKETAPVTTAKTQKDKETKNETAEVREGPKEVLRAKVIGTDAQYGFIVINKGEAEGVKAGYRFDILRRVRSKTDDAATAADFRLEKLAVGEFEKYLGTSRTQSKLKILEGRTQDIKIDDEAVAQRKIDPAKETSTETVPTIPQPGTKKAKITGKVGDSFMLNYGAQDGARQSDRVFVYREGRLRAQLRLDVVEKDYSIGRLIDHTQTGDFGVDSDILLKEQKNSIVGRVKWNDDKRGIIIEAGLKEGAKPGMQFEVRRQGRRVGLVVVKKADRFTSEVEPVGDLKREDVYVEDFVESLE